MTVDGSEFYVGRMKALNNQSQGRESSFGLNFPADDYQSLFDMKFSGTTPKNI